MLLSLALVLIVLCAAWWRPGVGLALATQGYLIRNAFTFDSAPAVSTAPNDATATGGGILGVVLPGIVFLIIGVKAVDGFRRYRIDVVDILLLALGGVLLFGSLHAPDRGLGAEITLRYVALGISFYYFSRLMVADGTRRSEQNLPAFLAATWAIAIVLGAVALLFGPGLASERLTVGSAHPIPFSLLIGMALVINVFWLVQENRAGLVAPMYASLAFLVFVFLASNTRGTAIACAISLLLLATLAIRKRFPVRAAAQIIATVIMAAVVVLILSAWQPDMVDRLVEGFSRASASDRGESIEDRLSAYSAALGMFTSNPVWGVGTGGFSAYHFLPYPHNMVLEIAAEQGLIGLTILTALLGVILMYLFAAFTAWRSMTYLPLLMALVVFNLVEAQFSFTLWFHKNLFVVLGLFVSQIAHSHRLLSIPSTRPGVPYRVSQKEEWVGRSSSPLITAQKPDPMTYRTYSPDPHQE
jgi:O-antigen ligase